MNAPIITLQTALDTLQTNEPINRAEGNFEQADSERQSIAEINHAIEVLKAVYSPVETFCTPHEQAWKETEFVQ